MVGAGAAAWMLTDGFGSPASPSNATPADLKQLPVVQTAYDSLFDWNTLDGKMVQVQGWVIGEDGRRWTLDSSFAATPTGYDWWGQVNDGTDTYSYRELCLDGRLATNTTHSMGALHENHWDRSCWTDSNATLTIFGADYYSDVQLPESPLGLAAVAPRATGYRLVLAGGMSVDIDPLGNILGATYAGPDGAWNGTVLPTARPRFPEDLPRKAAQLDCDADNVGTTIVLGCVPNVPFAVNASHFFVQLVLKDIDSYMVIPLSMPAQNGTEATHGIGFQNEPTAVFTPEWKLTITGLQEDGHYVVQVFDDWAQGYSIIAAPQARGFEFKPAPA